MLTRENRKIIRSTEYSSVATCSWHMGKELSSSLILGLAGAQANDCVAGANAGPDRQLRLPNYVSPRYQHVSGS